MSAITTIYTKNLLLKTNNTDANNNNGSTNSTKNDNGSVTDNVIDDVNKDVIEW